jgi:imidazolonepropionase-like amidohydrolase
MNMPSPGSRLAPLALAAACLVAACSNAAPAGEDAAADLAIVGVTVVDLARGQLLENHTVTVLGGRIAAVAPSQVSGNDVGADPLASPATRVVDGRGRWLIPGLWDAHVHFRGGEELADANRRLLPLFTANGITSVRDGGGDLTPHVLEWRERVAAGELAGPTIYTSGPKLDGPTGGWDGSIRLETPSEVAGALDSLQALGADYVKIYDGSIAGDVYLEIIREAERRRMPVSGHMPFSVRFLDAVEAGLDATEHLYYAYKGAAANEDSVTAAVRAGELGFWQALTVLREGWSAARADSVWRAMARAGTAVVPTLHIDDVLGHVADVDHSRDPRLAYIDPGIEATYEGRVLSARRSPAEMRQERIERHDDWVRMLGDMHRAGVSVMAGSDAGPFNSYVYPGWSLHAELEAMVEAGLSPLEALRSATIAPARFLGVDDRVGRIEPGYAADLVLLGADPLEDIGNAREIELVAQANGAVWTAEELVALLDEARRDAARRIPGQ